MDTNLTLFDFNGASVRTMLIDNEPWFVLKDVCDVLGVKNSRRVYNEMLDEDEKGVRKTYTPGGEQELQIVSESGVYSVIIRSNSEKAKPFRRWVTHEVLPSIRRQGYYSALPDKELLKLIQRRYKENPNFIDSSPFSDKVKSVAYEAAVRTQLDELWSKRTELSVEEYAYALYKICKDDARLARRESQRYKQWRQTKANLGTGYRW